MEPWQSREDVRLQHDPGQGFFRQELRKK